MLIVDVVRLYVYIHGCSIPPEHLQLKLVADGENIGEIGSREMRVAHIGTSFPRVTRADVYDADIPAHIQHDIAEFVGYGNRDRKVIRLDIAIHCFHNQCTVAQTLLVISDAEAGLESCLEGQSFDSIEICRYRYGEIVMLPYEIILATILVLSS